MSKVHKIIQKHRKECSALNRLLVEAVGCENFKESIQRLQFAKLLIEAVAARQACERLAWGLGETFESRVE